MSNNSLEDQIEDALRKDGANFVKIYDERASELGRFEAQTTLDAEWSDVLQWLSRLLRRPGWYRLNAGVKPAGAGRPKLFEEAWVEVPRDDAGHAPPDTDTMSSMGRTMMDIIQRSAASHEKVLNTAVAMMEQVVLANKQALELATQAATKNADVELSRMAIEAEAAKEKGRMDAAMTYAKTLGDLIALRKNPPPQAPTAANGPTADYTIMATEPSSAVQQCLDTLTFDERRDIVRSLWDAHANGDIDLKQCFYLIPGPQDEVDIRADVYVALRRASPWTLNIVKQVKQLSPEKLMEIGEKLNATTIEKLLALLEATSG